MSAPHATVAPSWAKGRRAVVVIFAVAGVAAFVASYFLPWWNFALFAPQYPKGLRLVIELTGVGGDVREINTINHYIGMGHLDDAADIERGLAGWLIAALGLFVVAVTVLKGRKWDLTAALLTLGLPLGFVLDTWGWMYHFGHDLDPRAPITMAPFTPTLFGEGKVGQFHTMATPGIGFGLALLGVACVGVAMWQRHKVCAVCPLAANCSGTCERQFVRIPLPPKGHAASASSSKAGSPQGGSPHAGSA
jgi:hypothetical protein